MKWVTSLTVAAAVVLLSGTSAMAGLRAIANWNMGPSTNPDWVAGNYPAWSGVPGPGLDRRIGTLDWEQAVSGHPHGAPHYPDSDGVGKWGGALKDDPWPEDSMMYVTIQNGDFDELQDAQGTIEFWFKPMWDPATDTNTHTLININNSRNDDDGIWLRYNGDGTITNVMKTVSPDFADVGHEWAFNPLIQDDWNHIAVTWDSLGTYSYCNGEKVGEFLYSGPVQVKMSWHHDWMGIFFGRDHGELDGAGTYESDGLWDAFAIWDEVIYSGAAYPLPSNEPCWFFWWDPNGDGFVGQFDLDIVLAMWGKSGDEITDPRADVYEDGFIGQLDLDFVLANWGQGTPPPAPVPEPATLSLLGLASLALFRRKRLLRRTHTRRL